MKTFLLLLMMCITSIGIVNAQVFPLDFEAGTYTFTDFDGGVVSVVDNPSATGINTSSKVAKMVKNAGQTWAGSYLPLESPIDFTAGTKLKMKVYSPKVGADVLLKVENLTDNTINFEKTVKTTVANQWEDLTFDYAGIDLTKVYQSVVIIFENGIMGDGSANFTYYFDDIMIDEGATETILPVLPLDFENTEVSYSFTDFDGGVVTIIDNPQSTGLNTSAKVGKMVKNAGQAWGGSWIALAAPIDFSTNKFFTMNVFSPKVGAKVLLKVENSSNGAIAYEKEVATTLANEWEELAFDYSGIDNKDYQKIVLIFELGTMGDGSANFTYLFDDIQLVDRSSGLSQIDLPVTFEGTEIDYTVTDFGGNSTVIGADPVNASNTVAIVTKTAGAETWAGTTIGTSLGYANVIPFTSDKSKISIRVYSPAASIPIRLKVEDHNDVTLTAETEAVTTLANAWEELIFDFSNVAVGTNPWNVATNFDKMSIFFNFGTNGTGAVYYFDDVLFVNNTNLNAIENDNFKVYSNMGIIHVNSKIAYGSIDVFDLSGKKIMSKIITNTNEEFAISAKGIFIVRVSDENQLPITMNKIVMY